MSSAYFRRIAEFAGVCINNRIDKINETHINFGKDALPVLSNVEYDITECVGEILARNEEDMPVFAKNKQDGWGHTSQPSIFSKLFLDKYKNNDIILLVNHNIFAG